MGDHIPHWINGRPWQGSGDRSGHVYNPATGQLIRTVRFAAAADVDAAVSSACQTSSAWAATPLARRTEVLFAFREALRAATGDLAALITEEHGKVLADATGEVSRGLEVAEFACGISHLMEGRFSENVSTGVDVHSIRQPLGVVGVISPFNFPAMVPLWFAPVAIAAGNAVILKPSEKDPSAANALGRLWSAAGLPDGVFSVVHGDSVAVNRLLEHPDVQAISFVGSTPVARHVYETGTRHGKRVQALGGAKNHMLVLPDADLDGAADAAVSAGFGSAGERCMAISAVLAVDPVGDDLVARIRERMSAIRVGDGRRACDMGPLITAAHRDRVSSYIDAGLDAGAKLVVDGRGVSVDGDPQGFWLGPTLFDHATPQMSLYTDEIFGPVLSVLRVRSLDAGIEMVNANPYGNGAAIFTGSGGAARRFQADVAAGMIGVNVPIPVPVAHHSFGGWKASLFGDAHAYGTDGVRFFTRGKVVTSRWPAGSPAPSPLTVDLQFPGGGQVP